MKTIKSLFLKAALLILTLINVVKNMNITKNNNGIPI